MKFEEPPIEGKNGFYGMLNEFLEDKQAGVDHQKVKNKLKETSDKIEKW